MYAIVEIQGKQFKVSEGQQIFVNRLKAEKDSKVTFEKVLLLANGDNFQVGAPTVNARVEATVVSHLLADKVIIFKKRRRKGYKVKRGHRQPISKIKIDSIA